MVECVEPRHSCDQSDGLDSYTWTTYDPRQGGVQIIKDSPNNVEITTELLKVPGGKNGGSWAARIKGKPINPGISSNISWFLSIFIIFISIPIPNIYYLLLGIRGTGRY